MRRVEERRKEDEARKDRKLIEEVERVEAREERKQESARKSKAARNKANRDEQEWLEEAPRMETDVTNLSTPPPPNRPRCQLGRNNGGSWRKNCARQQ